MRKVLAVIITVFVLSTSVVTQSGYAAEEPGISSQEILIGATYPQTGAASPYYASYFAGANAYFTYLNAQGGVYGRKIKLITFDDQFVPMRTVMGTSQLILKDKVFSLFSSSPGTANHMAMSKSVNPGRRGIPSLFPLVNLSEFKDSAKYPTTFVLEPSSQQEARAIANFTKDEFSNLPFNALIQSEFSAEVSSAWSNMGYTVKSFTGFSVGSPGSRITMKEKEGSIFLSDFTGSRSQSSDPLIAGGNAVSSFSRLVQITQSDWANTYAGLYLPLPNESNDEFVTFFNKIFSTYLPGQPIDAKTIAGANAAYIVAQVFSAVGPQITRQKVLDFLRSKGSTLSHAGYEPLNFGNEVSSNKVSLYFARFDGTTWSRYSKNYSTELYSNIVSKTSPYRSQLLPNGLPIPISSKITSNISITCVKGKLTKKVTAVKPKCPTGYKKK
jgi:ABC-type branched-subunit amino acid transport system substrate-binding protein